MFDLGTVLTLYPPPTRPRGPLTTPAPPRQADVSAVSAAPARVMTCPERPRRTGTNRTENTTAPPPAGAANRSEER